MIVVTSLSHYLSGSLKMCSCKKVYKYKVSEFGSRHLKILIQFLITLNLQVN